MYMKKQYNECTLPASIFVSVWPILSYLSLSPKFPYNWIILSYILIFVNTNNSLLLLTFL